jgi:hypothetical protein
LLKWFTDEYPKHSTAKLDMGKACIRFKKPEHIPYKLIGELVKKITVKDWIETYEKILKRPLKRELKPHPSNSIIIYRYPHPSPCGEGIS